MAAATTAAISFTLVPTAKNTSRAVPTNPPMEARPRPASESLESWVKDASFMGKFSSVRISGLNCSSDRPQLLADWFGEYQPHFASIAESEDVLSGIQIFHPSLVLNHEQQHLPYMRSQRKRRGVVQHRTARAEHVFVLCFDRV